jgi:hypothetical protein
VGAGHRLETHRRPPQGRRRRFASALCSGSPPRHEASFSFAIAAKMRFSQKPGSRPQYPRSDLEVDQDATLNCALQRPADDHLCSTRNRSGPTTPLSERRQVLIRAERTANHVQTSVSASHDRVHDCNCLASDWSGSIGDEGRHPALALSSALISRCGAVTLPMAHFRPSFTKA